MGVFHVFQTAQMVTNRAKHHYRGIICTLSYTNQYNGRNESFFQTTLQRLKNVINPLQADFSFL